MRLLACCLLPNLQVTRGKDTVRLVGLAMGVLRRCCVARGRCRSSCYRRVQGLVTCVTWWGAYVLVRPGEVDTLCCAAHAYDPRGQRQSEPSG